ncbi:hypothetical protein Ct61P_09929 [Colletotrichum tofieldiae]|nr:hypothetical protein Ct61P_09929 [Colletotrichum tofieldiae]
MELWDPSFVGSELGLRMQTERVRRAAERDVDLAGLCRILSSDMAGRPAPQEVYSRHCVRAPLTENETSNQQ